MERHLLVTVGDDKSAWFGIQFAAHFFQNKEAIKMTLFYTAPRPVLWDEKSKVAAQRQAEQESREIEAKGKKALDAAKTELVARGFKTENIDTKMRFRQISKIDDIIEEGEAGRYDAVVFGRRGLTRIEEALDDSVTRGVMEKTFRFPMWICRKPDTERKNVLLCIDGSDSAYRMADHVGYLIGKEDSQRITLFMVNKKGKTTEENPEGILSKAREKLASNDFPESRIDTKTVDSNNVRKSILDEAEKGGFSVVAAGRTGAGEGFFKKIFMGSASMYLFRELEGASLWVCH
jgi:nucleotide-binding universal stress UspA family protein